MQRKFTLLLIFAALLFAPSAFAQMVGDNTYLQGHFVEVGVAKSGCLGATRNPPSGYHAHPGTSFSVYDMGTSCTASTQSGLLACVYDYGHDGWTTGSPAYTGDYTLPGSPFEEWAIEVGGVTRYASFISYESGCSGWSGTGDTGRIISYSNTGGVVSAIWYGTAASGNLQIRKEYRVDTEGSALVITAVFTNVGSTTLTGLYYFRSADPDNDASWPCCSGTGYSTNNTINYVSSTDYYHRAEVTATSTTNASSHIGLATKDCRAKALIYNDWPPTTSISLSSIYAGTATGLGGEYFQNSHNGDIAIGLVYSLGDLPAGDSTIISYAYVFNGYTGIEDAFPNPQMVVDGVAHDSTDTATLCNSATLPVSVINGTTKDWSWSSWTWAPATGLSSTTGVSNVIDGGAISGTIVYTITGTDSAMGDCQQKTFYLTINSYTSPPPTPHDTVLCLGVTSTPLNADGTSLLWYTSSTGGVGSPTAPIPVTTSLGVDTYWVSQTVGTCESSRVPLIVTVLPPPVVTLANNSPLCPGDNLQIVLSDTLTATGLTYSWTGPGGFTSTVQNPFISGVVFADSGIYTVVVDNNGCFTAPTSTLALIHSTPPNPVVTNPTYCQDSLSVALAATGANILWYPTATGGVGSPIAPTPSTALSGTFTFYVTQTVNSCESNRQPVVVTVNPNPAPPVVVDNPGAYCPGQAFVPFTVVSGSNILWYSGAVGGPSTPVAPTPSTATSGTFTWWVTQTVLGCQSIRTPVSITVYTGVTAGFDTFIHHGCVADTVIFNNTSTNAINYLWEFGDGNSSTLANPTHVYTAQGTYTVKLYANSATCIDSMVETLPLVHPILANFTLSPSIVCQGIPAAFRDTSTATLPEYSWDFGDGSTSTLKDPYHSYLHTGVYNITLTVTDNFLCTSQASGSITVDSFSAMSMSISDTVLCRGAHIDLGASFTTEGISYYVWNFGDGDSILNVNPVVYGFPVTGTYMVSITAHYRACPDAFADKIVNVFDVPVISLGADTTICAGSASLVLTDAINAGNPFASWLWNTGQTTSSITVTSAGAYEATVSIGGCSATDSVNVTDDCMLALPNVFTPNGDGVNDYFNPRDFLQGLKTFSMTIYNRWGQVVFQTDNIEGSGWDGKYNNELQPQGVYIYIITATFKDGQQQNKQGNLTLIR